MARILVLGSVARDDVIHLRTPLREGAHLEGIDQGARLGGGAGNTGLALACAGHETLLVAPIGDDECGQHLLKELQANGVDVSLVHQVEGATTRSLVMIDDFGERTIVNVARAREPQPPGRVLDVAADALYVRAGTLNLDEILAQKADDCLVVAHMPPCIDGARPAHILVASESDLDASQLAEPFKLGRRVSGGIVKWVVITRGGGGADAYGRRRTLHVDSPVVDPVDTTGAGDAFAAGLLHALTSGGDTDGGMEAALAQACQWGAAATQCLSSALPTEAVNALLTHQA